MNKYKYHHCQEGENREVLLAVSTRFCRFLKGDFCRKSPILTEGNGRFEPGGFRDLIGHIGNGTGRFSISWL